MYKVFKLSEVGTGFRGRVVYVDVDEKVYRYFNMGFYPGNPVILIHRGERYSIVRLGRRIMRIENSILDKVLVVEDPELPIVEWS